MANHDNLHTPERLTSETYPEYKARRQLSQQIARQYTRVASGSETSRQALRNAQRKSGAMKRIAGRFARGLRNHLTRKQATALNQ